MLTVLVVAVDIIIIIRRGRRKAGNRDPFIVVVGVAGGLVVIKGEGLVISTGHEWWWWWTRCYGRGCGGWKVAGRLRQLNSMHNKMYRFLGINNRNETEKSILSKQLMFHHYYFELQ